MGLLEGKVAFITGAGRGQGRSHAVRLAQEGADIIAVDICAPIESVTYPLATREDLEETARQVQAEGRKISWHVADVRNEADLRNAFDLGVKETGPVDIVLANAGIASTRDSPGVWDDIVQTNLTGVFNTIEVAIPSMEAGRRGGSIVLTSSTAGINGTGGPDRASLAYYAAKHGLVGLMRCYANNLAKHSIRVNSIHPTGVNTPMIRNPQFEEYLERSGRTSALTNALPVTAIESEDVSNAIVWLVSDLGRYVTGVTLPIDAGFSNMK